MPPSIPLLVESLINWYKWRIEWREIIQFVNRYSRHNENPRMLDFYGRILQYRCMTDPNMFPIVIRNSSFNAVACLPPRYFYSSGLNNPNGFNNNFD